MRVAIIPPEYGDKKPGKATMTRRARKEGRQY
jgi:hypothetical protein